MKLVNTADTAPARGNDGDSMLDITSCFDVLLRYKRTFFLAAITVIVVGLIYALMARPIYRSDIMVQVEEPNSNGGPSKLGSAISPVLDVKPATTAEIELLRSRMVVGKAVDALHLDIEASPRYFPVVGARIASFDPELSTPGLFGWGGFAWGSESIKMPELNVPETMEGRKITLTALGNHRYRVAFSSDSTTAEGTVGKPLTVHTASGDVSMLVTQLEGRPGTQFVARKQPRDRVLAELQDALFIGERGKQSGVIFVSLEGPVSHKAAAILNEIGSAYVDQNVRRKGEEAEKSLSFLENQVPQLKQQVEAAESRYNAMRHQRGTIDLGEESKLILAQSVQVQTKLQELQQKRQELASRFTPEHPAIGLIDRQIGALNAQLGGVSGKIQRLPDVEQNVLRLMRDVKVSTEMLQSLQNDVQQLRLMKASKVGTSRLVDSASEPTKPVRPNRLLLSALSVMLGVIAGLALVTIRHLLDGGLADADDIERQTGMTVYTTVPQSSQQARVESENKEESTLLAVTHPEEAAIESLRSFRTALQFALAGNPNRSVVITGPAPGIGKSFISANLAAVAASGKRAVLIDADLRRGSQHRHFGVKRSPGLSELLLGAPLEQVVQRDVLPGLDFIPTGAEPPLSADVFLSPCMDAMLEQLRLRYDIVIIDTAPVLAAADAGILAGKAGAVFLVARAEKTTVAELVAARRSLEQAGAEVRGVIFNGLIVEGRWYRSNQYFGKYRYMSEYGTTRQKQA